MSTIIKVKPKGQLTIPIRLRSQVGLAEGDLVEARAEHGKIVLTPKIKIRGGYSPPQHWLINSRLERAEADIKAGRVSKRFSDHKEFVRALHDATQRLSSRKGKRPGQ